MISFWKKRGLLNYLLLPVSALYLLGHFINYQLSHKRILKTVREWARKQVLSERNVFFTRDKSRIRVVDNAPPLKSEEYSKVGKVICVGNATVGGTGKTPFALALGRILLAKGMRIAFISRGYKGRLSGSRPVLVENYHDAIDVGDEALLLMRVAPTYICANRQLAAQVATEAGADIIIMDDGLQNNTIKKDVTILIVDGDQGFGNGFVLPAGPLREPLSWALAKTDFVFGYIYPSHFMPGIDFPKIYTGKLVPSDKNPSNISCVAMCGIGNPDKFFHSLEQAKIKIKKHYIFHDHHYFSLQELDKILQYANSHGLRIITTGKDIVRLPATVDKTKFDVFEVETEIPEELVDNIISRLHL